MKEEELNLLVLNYLKKKGCAGRPAMLPRASRQPRLARIHALMRSGS